MNSSPRVRPSRQPSGKRPSARTGVGAAAPGAPVPAHPWLVPALLLALAAVLMADTFRLGFFADDFHMLDVARRIPLLALLGGDHGIFPWYRPLSRELFFALIAAAGPYDVWLARIVSLLCVAAAAWQVRAIAARVAGPRAGVAAAALFVAHATTKFLVAWASGFQDVLAMLLVLSAFRDHAEGRAARSLAWAFLAVFAKETAFLVFPLLALQTLLSRPARDAWRPWLAQLGVCALAVALHLGVRLGWQGAGRQVEVERSLSGLAQAVLRVIAGFVGSLQAPEPGAVLLAAAAGVACLLLMRFGGQRLSAAKGEALPDATGRRAGVLLIAGGALLGFMPLVIGNAMGVVTASSYYAFSAVPWLAMLAGVALARLPFMAGAVALAALVSGNALTLGHRAPDLSQPSAWEFREWDWPEAVRLSAISERLGEDLRTRLAGRPDSAVVLFFDLPKGCFFQSEDGPATRESLRDLTVRSYWTNAAPFGLRPEEFEILRLDPATRHLVPFRPSVQERGVLAASSVTGGEPAVGWVFANHGPPQENAAFDFRYYRVLASLLAEGVAGARRELEAVGLADTLGAAPMEWATAAVGPGALHAPMVEVLRHPLDARAHLAMANACAAANALVFEGVELRFAVTLDPGLLDERMRLAKNLLENGKPESARRDLAQLLVDARGTPIEGDARALLARAFGR